MKKSRSKKSAYSLAESPPPPPGEPASAATNGSAPQVLINSIHMLWESGKHADLEVKCHDKSFKVHKCIVSSQGGLFGANKEAFVEGETGILDLSEDDSNIIGALLKHLYGIAYTVPSEHESAAIFHALVYSKADMFLLLELKKEAKNNFESVVRRNAAEGAKLALGATEAVYGDIVSSDRGLKNIVVDVVGRYRSHLFGDSEENRRILHEAHELAYDLALAPVAAMEPKVCEDKEDKEDKEDIFACTDCNYGTLHIQKNCDYCGASFT